LLARTAANSPRDYRLKFDDPKTTLGLTSVSVTVLSSTMVVEAIEPSSGLGPSFADQDARMERRERRRDMIGESFGWQARAHAHRGQAMMKHGYCCNQDRKT